MKRSVTLLALMMVVAFAQVAAAKGAAKGIGGKWSAQKMQRGKEVRDVPKGLSIGIEFSPKGKFRATLSKTREGKVKTDVQNGSWKIAADILTTNVKKKEEKMKFKVEGDTLVLIKIGKDEKLYLKRAK